MFINYNIWGDPLGPSWCLCRVGLRWRLCGGGIVRDRDGAVALVSRRDGEGLYHADVVVVKCCRCRGLVLAWFLCMKAMVRWRWCDTTVAVSCCGGHALSSLCCHCRGVGTMAMV